MKGEDSICDTHLATGIQSLTEGVEPLSTSAIPRRALGRPEGTGETAPLRLPL
jgi:hypothetical protein